MDVEAYADMLPWLIFVVVNRRSGLNVSWASGSAAVCSLGLVVWSYWRGLRSPLPRLGVVLFSSCLAVGLAVPWWNESIGLPRACMVGALSLAAFLSLWRTPLSEAYTTPLVAASTRRDARFRQVNVEITAAWGAGTALVALACGTTALLTDAYAFTFFGWVLPLVLAGFSVLWTARRWDLFRVAVEATASLEHRFGAVVSLSAGGAVGDGEDEDEDEDDEEGDAEIRPFPLRRA